MPNYVLYHPTTGKINSYAILPPEVTGIDEDGHIIMISDPVTNLEAQIALGIYDVDGQTPSYLEVDEEIDTQAEVDQYYVLGGVLTEKPNWTSPTWSKTTITADGTDEALIENLPAGATIAVRVPSSALVPPEAYTTEFDGESYSFKTPVAGEYTIRIEAFPFKPYTTTITAEEA